MDDKFLTVKRRLYEIIEASRSGDFTSKAYDIMILISIAVGLIPLTIKGENHYTRLIDLLTVCIFTMDYVLRIYTSDYKMGIKSYKAYVANALMPISIIDLLSVAPILTFLFPVSKTIGLLRIFRVLLLLKVMRYSTTMIIIANVLRKVWKPLSAVFTLVFVYIVTCALIIFQIEPDTFASFPEAVYWAGCTVLAVGYGDITPLTPIGRAMTVVSAVVGMAVIALPSGIITAAYMNEMLADERLGVAKLGNGETIVVDYGYNIPGICDKVQEKVKTAIENMTGLNVADINIRIAGVNMDATNK